MSSSIPPTGRDALLAGMTSRIRQSLDLSQILATTVLELRAFLQVDRTKVYRFEAEGNGHTADSF
ncbi:hypothetical protein [Candidatus Cyanaurora vandensis]|uniref:hypothetical protein n=1 Tax=Candidatus Cyanaurora vandensis TaxID=2714958 RepID=UPI00257A810D|nr:hypothetical protein [Candidatus Cyanaurora vandensis]